MLRILSTVIVALVVMFANSAAMSADLSSPVGLWKTIDDKTNKPKSHFRITDNNGVLSGTVVKTFPSANYVNGKCSGCEGPYHNKSLNGVTLLRGMKAEKGSTDTWSGGKITDPLDGKTYRCTMQLTNGGRSLKVRGYIGIQLLGRTQIWQRVN